MLRQLKAWARGNPIAVGAAVLAWLMAKAIIDGALLAMVLWLAVRVGML